MSKLLTLIAFCFMLCSISTEAEAAWGSSSQTGGATLYYSSTCPHCTTVLNYIRSNGISVTTKNISNPTYRNELQQLGQRSVPVLVVNGRVITGDSSIISYLGGQQ